MTARFLLGPAGSGKTFRCLAEIGAALGQHPDGPPLILLAPKQATFQLERQLLAVNAFSGYARLHVFSFDRLARFILEKLLVPLPRQLNEEGRVMVLRALLVRHDRKLKLFRRSSRRPGFAQQLSRLLGELQQHQLTPARLKTLAGRFPEGGELQAKLTDLALLDEAYADWLAEHNLQDVDHLPNFAVKALHSRVPVSGSQLQIGGLWLDGFAEMTPEELDLLTAVLPHCEHATLAFCLESRPETGAPDSWLSIWSAVAKTYQQCRQRIEQIPDCNVVVEVLPRNARNRFAEQSPLRHLERNWSGAARSQANGDRQSPISLTACTNPQTEAVFAAREVLKFVRSGHRFRDCAVLVRALDDYHQPLGRAFRRFHIPFFLDRRESAAHHPLAELTRSALRTAAFDWQHDDWFAALKAGFSPVDEAEIDRLENAALEFGWEGAQWHEPIQIPENAGRAESLEPLRQKLLPPFEALASNIARRQRQPTGAQLAESIRQLWDALGVEQTLERWNAPVENQPCVTDRQPAIHMTVWEGMNAWLDNVALAFSQKEPLPLRDWLPILEAGLANLTIGVVPPALDQVLIGAVDRARNPDLKLAIVLGANEDVFPAAPPAPPILTRSDRDELEQSNIVLGPNLRDQLARERYLGYIACTRASRQLAVSFAHQDANGKALNPSSLVTHLRSRVPGLEIAEFRSDADWREAEHVSELATPLAGLNSPLLASRNPLPATQEERRGDRRDKYWSELLELPVLRSLAESLRQLREPDPVEKLSPNLAEKLYGPVLQTSVSGLEEFAQCPFRFFVHSGLRAEERKIFELDARERGSFQHEVLSRFHQELVAEGKRWRDLNPAEARERIGTIAATLASNYRGGLLHADDQGRFTARVLSESLQDFVETLVTWMRGQYEFDPVLAELEFGMGNSGAPAWEIDLGNGHRLALRGRIDRLDLWRDAAGHAWCVVMDYKSGHRKLDKLLVEHGIQLQLLGYLAAIRQWPNTKELLKVERLIPAGVFYVDLRGKYESSHSRSEALSAATEARCLAYRHTGRFSMDALPKLDSRPAAEAGDQFNFRRKVDGSLHKGSSEALPHTEFVKLLDRVETQLADKGRAIYAGAVSVDPYRKGSDTACRYCDFGGVCRIDPWTHRYRVLKATPKEILE